MLKYKKRTFGDIVMLNNIYWRLRSKGINFVFFIKKHFYKSSVYATTEKTVLKRQKNVFFDVPKKIILNFILFACTLCSDKLLEKILKFEVNIDQTLISDILIALVSVAGVFLGLYCSYIATVFSSKYVNAPQEISNLFRDDLINSKSITAITNYMIFSIIVIISNLLYENIGLITIAINFILAIYMIVSYVYIGKRILTMSNTYSVAESIYDSFFREFKKISSSRVFANDANFQNHIKKVTYKNIEMLKIINIYNLGTEENKNQSLFNFMYNNLILLSSYMNTKKHIPYDSLWFKTNEYNKWYKASYHELITALNTGTFLKNIDSTDNFWFEKELLKINEYGLDELIKNKDYDLIRKYISCLQQLVSDSIEVNDSEYWIDYLGAVQRKVISLITNDNINVEIGLSLIESLVVVYLHFGIHLFKYFKDFNLDEILQYSVDNVCFEEYKYFQFFNNPILGKMYQAIKSEKKIENKKITPDWYIQQYVSKEIYDTIVMFCNSLNKINENIVSLADEFSAKSKHTVAAFVYSKYIEWYHKIYNVLPCLNTVLEKSKAYHKENTNYIWEEYDINSLTVNIDNSYNDVLAKWGDCATYFALSNWDNYNDFPDMLGACYNNICNFLVQSLIKNDFSAFEKTYPSLWKTTVLYQELIRKDLIKVKEPYKQDSVIVTLSNPILDFGNISGYAYLWGEIIGDNKWQNLIIECFDKMLDSFKEEKEERCIRISDFLSIPSKLGSLRAHRSLLWTSWKTMIENAFMNSGEIKWEHKGFQKVIKTDSQWLKNLIGTHSDLDLMLEDAYEIFGVFILNKYLPEDKKFKTRWGWENEKD